jgi:hypothetical protein
MVRHGVAFLQALVEREEVLRREFAEIDVIGAGLDFDQCVDQAKAIMRPLLNSGGD